MSLGLAGFVRVAVEAFIEAGGLPVDVPSVRRVARTPLAATPVSADRAPVDIGALLKRGQEDRAQAGKHGARPKAGEMCKHRLLYCKECHGAAA